MIVGVGTDLCDMGRIREALAQHGERFARRILGDQEWEVYQSRTAAHSERGVRYLAMRFAAKEAFSKAIGLGLRDPMSWHRCEIINAPSGQPGIVLHGPLLSWFEARQWQAHVSLSDEREQAMAFVVIETHIKETNT